MPGPKDAEKFVHRGGFAIDYCSNLLKQGFEIEDSDDNVSVTTLQADFADRFY